MIIKSEIVKDLKIRKLEDLKKISELEKNNNLKVNRSALAREMGVDRRTIDKYIKGYRKTMTRNRPSCCDAYYEIIKSLLSDENRIFVYKSILYRYLKENHGLNIPRSTFDRYILIHEEFNSYFVKVRNPRVSGPAAMRYETEAGKQAQLDWKEAVDILLKTGEIVTVNIFVLILSYSRFRVYKLSILKTQDILLNFMDEAFETFGGVPSEIVTDNMKTVMDESRTEYSSGKINNKFKQFADDYGFQVHPCVAARPETKSKVESPMRILDELRAYGGQLDLNGLVEKLNQINNRENTIYHEGYNGIPLLLLDEEKDFLKPLPHKALRSQYKINTTSVKVNNSSLVRYKSHYYSVPPEYIGKTLKLQVYDNQLHLYYNTTLITLHFISDYKLNYIESHYIEIAKLTLPFSEDKIEEIAKENLRVIGERYNVNGTSTTSKQPGLSKASGDEKPFE